MFVQSKRFILDNTPSSHNASCFDSKNDCDFLNMTYSICSNTQLAKEHCQLFCNLCYAVDGHWSDWGPWSECTVSCGSGPRSRVRSCDNPPPVRGGVDCFGSDHDQDVCVLETCPDGWDSWSDWSTCSETCGTGLKRRQRTCNDTKGTLFGGGCIGNDQEQKECNIKSCDTVVLFYSHGPIDMNISSNEKIIYGTVTINRGGGYNSSTGQFTAPHDGLYLFTSQACISPGKGAFTGITKKGVSTVIGQTGVYGADATSRVGMEQGYVLDRATILRQCALPNKRYLFITHCFVDGWDRWSDWSSCSVTCGPGFKHRYRTCNDTIETILGGGCVGNDQEYTECNMTSCEMIVLFYADGPRNKNISINETIVYSSVTTNIGGGYNSTSGVFIAPHEGLFLFTSQTCIQAGNSIWVGIVKDGAMIQDSMLSSTKDDTCNSMQAAVQLRVEERDRWSDWSSCSDTCGPGLKHRHRTCNDTINTTLGSGCGGNDKEYAE
ncbi:ECT-like protein, partial [Mya arenaria]